MTYLRALRLFAAVVWRPWGVYADGSTWRLDVRTAWAVARILHLED